MAVIPEENLYMTSKDEDGFHHLRHRTCKEPGPCTSFDCNGRTGKKCEKFWVTLNTRVKMCSK